MHPEHAPLPAAHVGADSFPRVDSFRSRCAPLRRCALVLAAICAAALLSACGSAPKRDAEAKKARDEDMVRQEQRLAVLTAWPVETLRSRVSSSTAIPELPALVATGTPADWLRRRGTRGRMSRLRRWDCLPSGRRSGWSGLRSDSRRRCLFLSHVH